MHASPQEATQTILANEGRAAKVSAAASAAAEAFLEAALQDRRARVDWWRQAEVVLRRAIDQAVHGH